MQIELAMRKVLVLLLMIPAMLSCEEVVPKGYYRAKITRDTAEFCTLVSRVKGSKTNGELDKYEYIYIKNLPEELKAIGAEFYFKSWEEVETPGCLANTYSPHLTINIHNISTKRPK